MKEKWSTFKESLSDVTAMTKREYLLTLAVCILGGIVFGMLFSPRKQITIGCNNGNNNRGSLDSTEKKKSNTADWKEIEEREEQK